MTNPSRSVRADEQTIDGAVTITTLPGASALTQEQVYRSGAYSLLARLLRSPPDSRVMQQVAGFAELESKRDSKRDEMILAMSMLGLAANTSSPERVDDEFHALFIGIGRGELVPYASWYLTGYLMEKPLGRLRDDLSALGFQRQEGVMEPEDHVAALCEVMSALIDEASPIGTQSHFFERHMADWLESFFDDLSESGSAVFYKAVGRFGKAFSAMEKRYFSMPV